ncbi:peptidyl-prolyl cis-trans isomerase [Sporosarcina sp. Marseille-Q4063]|uniref:peptidyl-prolyl cis-trans isomerase n=1 Tax=Sporosarcina sp. Marseille-Q4063 TaxID=2810514 RepID=UPI001BAF9C5E|nr:peptidyl-prolyl cis-trans isomerase [Sporosarcina sp. Marseille-Q4063]QUW20707.1 peptidyl-prolyl cis-trans isomerase [Sporosarcina sp. Marseille-Q4063]
MKYNRGHKEDQTKHGTRRLKAKPLLIVIGILLFSNLLWFIAWKVTDKSWETGEVVASVDGETIKRETWMAAMEEKIGRETLLELVNNKVMEAAAKKYDIKVSNKEIDLELALIHSVDDQIFTGMTAEKEREKISASMILEKILTKDIVVSDEAIQASYDGNASLYNIENAYRTAIIVLSSKDEAENALSELNEGSSFNILARERSIDASTASLGGDLGYISENKDSIDSSIFKSASSLKPNTTSGVISLSNGNFAILHVSDVMKGKTFKFKEVKNHIKRKLAMEQLTETVNMEAFWKEFDTSWFYRE